MPLLNWRLFSGAGDQPEAAGDADRAPSPLAWACCMPAAFCTAVQCCFCCRIAPVHVTHEKVFNSFIDCCGSTPHCLQTTCTWRALPHTAPWTAPRCNFCRSPQCLDKTDIAQPLFQASLGPHTASNARSGRRLPGRLHPAAAAHVRDRRRYRHGRCAVPAESSRIPMDSMDFSSI